MVRRLFPAHLAASGEEPLHIVEVAPVNGQPWSVIVSLYPSGVFVEICDHLVGWQWGEWSSFEQYPELASIRNGDRFDPDELAAFVEGLNEA